MSVAAAHAVAMGTLDQPELLASIAGLLRDRDFLTVQVPETQSGHKLHVSASQLDHAIDAYTRLRGVVEARGLGLKIGTAKYFDANARGSNHQKGVTIYLPHEATAADDALAVLQSLHGYPHGTVISGEEYWGNGVSYRWERGPGQPRGDLSTTANAAAYERADVQRVRDGARLFREAGVTRISSTAQPAAARPAAPSPARARRQAPEPGMGGVG